MKKIVVFLKKEMSGIIIAIAAMAIVFISTLFVYFLDGWNKRGLVDAGVVTEIESHFSSHEVVVDGAVYKVFSLNDFGKEEKVYNRGTSSQYFGYPPVELNQRVYVYRGNGYFLASRELEQSCVDQLMRRYLSNLVGLFDLVYFIAFLFCLVIVRRLRFFSYPAESVAPWHHFVVGIGIYLVVSIIWLLIW